MAMLQHEYSSIPRGRIWRIAAWLDGVAQSFAGGQGASMHAEHPQDAEVQHTIFSYALAALACKLMRVDSGEIHPKERAMFLTLFVSENVSLSRMRALMSAAAKDTAPMQQYARQLVVFCEGREQQKRDILFRLVRLALSDGLLHEREYGFLCDLSGMLGVSVREMAEIIDSVEGSLEVSPWHLLKVERFAPLEDIQKAYHDAMRSCHPDRWKNAGNQAVMYELATQRSKAVNEAYKFLVQQYKKKNVAK